MSVFLKSATVTVTTKGTPVKVLADGTQNIVGVLLQPQSNTIYVGDSTVKYSTPIGIKVASTDAPLKIPMDSVNVIDLNKLYVDADTDGTKVNVLLFIRV